ncbi:MAG: hypothetical protein J7513_14785 [Solirubrobacteraceae bacterium]|nr:hypothetical protein [Solirubrobacteraceae bacterium]
MKQKFAFIGGGLLLAEVAFVCALATKDVPARESVAPRILEAFQGHDGRGFVVARAQDPGGTIVGLTVRWSDGRETTERYPCERTDFGGATVTLSVADTKRGDATATGIRATGRACFYDAPERSGPWVAVTPTGGTISRPAQSP